MHWNVRINKMKHARMIIFLFTKREFAEFYSRFLPINRKTFRRKYHFRLSYHFSNVIFFFFSLTNLILRPMYSEISIVDTSLDELFIYALKFNYFKLWFQQQTRTMCQKIKNMCRVTPSLSLLNYFKAFISSIYLSYIY